MSLQLQHHHHSRSHLYPAVEIDHVLIGHPDAARGNCTSELFGLIGAVDAIQRVLAASIQVKGACPHWITRAAWDVARKRAKPPLLTLSWRPSRPFLLTANRGHARPSLSSLAHGCAIANRLASRQHVVDEGSAGLDHDRACCFPPVVLNDLALIVQWNRHPLIGRVCQLLPITRCKIGFRRGGQSAGLHAASEQQPGEKKHQAPNGQHGVSPPTCETPTCEPRLAKKGPARNWPFRVAGLLFEET